MIDPENRKEGEMWRVCEVDCVDPNACLLLKIKFNGLNFYALAVSAKLQTVVGETWEKFVFLQGRSPFLLQGWPCSLCQQLRNKRWDFSWYWEAAAFLYWHIVTYIIHLLSDLQLNFSFLPNKCFDRYIHCCVPWFIHCLCNLSQNKQWCFLTVIKCFV